VIPPAAPRLPAHAPAKGGVLARNVMQFARLLRRAGLPVGPGDAEAAQRALLLVDLGRRDEVRAALRAVMTRRREQQEVFDHAFALFWRDPAASTQAAILAMLDGRTAEPPARPSAGSRRAAEAMQAPRPPRPQEREAAPEREAILSVSDRERLQAMDFEAMSAAELAQVRTEIARLSLPLDRRRTRRFRPDPLGAQVDLRATLRTSLRRGGEVMGLSRRSRAVRPPPLVILCDISGSMARYAQVLLHFLHAVANRRDRVHVFLFGTRLSNITRQLRHRDAEVAFQMVAQSVPDWSGGTRIGEAIAGFNRDWGRRVLGQGAVVLLMTDGLDRPRDGRDTEELSAEMDRLHRSCRRLIWLNPLLRYAGFEPRSQGIRAMLPHVDEFRTIHNLNSLRVLIDALSRPAPSGRAYSWKEAA
jgi:uncharacterized protein with von Willebrand factor type A (vWA) domain